MGNVETVFKGNAERLKRRVPAGELTTRERFLRQGADAVITTPEEFQKLMQSEYAKYQKLVKDAGISTQ